MSVDVLISLNVLTCGECGIQFGVPPHWEAARRKDHVGWNCPNGHSRVFNAESQEELLRRHLADRDRQLAEARRDALSKGSMLSGERTKNKNLRKRISNGVCPCCTRSFANLKRHIATKHPDYGKAKA